MTLDEAIKHCEEVANQKNIESYTAENFSDKERYDCLECAKEHEQLAEWLKELKESRTELKKLRALIYGGNSK